ncbi:DUF5687 family protein [Flagellimonas lutaonensis]|uniref:Membrane protein n=1 Tax=Flagellimonas lutaonensis TaxID=516051 RepID=A0A0D5YT48_9FLAO|nr:DUF5687 family protein [Allomuricauda lutaonensis]AKA35016.1 membrane protein [Allomuricauda lutaonensis]
MFKHFLRLQWKSFFRSSSFGKSMAIKILMGFFSLYLMAVLIISGGGLYFILRKLVPDQNPLWVVSQYMVYWVLIELFVRYFMQKLPVMDIKPLLLAPIKKSAIAHYILGRSAASWYNLMALFFFIPFGIVLIVKGYGALNVWTWILGIFALVLCVNYVNFLINKSDKALIGIVVLVFGLYAMDHFGLIPVKEVFGPLFHALYAYPLAVLVPLALSVMVYWANFRFLKTHISLEGALKVKTKEAKTSELAWTRRFGDLAPFLQLDLRMIWRNKRTKSQVWISLLFVFYGLIFYTQDIYADMKVMHCFLGIFMTGIFLSNFGQFIPAWDSSYYQMMMSQNIPLRKYLESKALLITVSVVVMFFLTIPYVYFGTDVLAINFASALYNLGVNIPVILYFGSFNKKRIELDQSPFGNMQGTSATQFLIILPVLGLPIALFALFHFIFSFQVALIVLSAMGIIGFALRNYFMERITEQYRKKKYGMIAGFKEKNG